MLPPDLCRWILTVSAASIATAAQAEAITEPPPTNELRYRLFEGTVIDTVLTNRLDGTFTVQ